jgi:hypothetical protein
VGFGLLACRVWAVRWCCQCLVVLCVRFDVVEGRGAGRRFMRFVCGGVL